TMPAMTGATLVAELRRIRPDIPIILCTGFSPLMNADKAQALGVDAFLMKPVGTHALAVTIHQVLHKRASRSPSHKISHMFPICSAAIGKPTGNGIVSTDGVS